MSFSQHTERGSIIAFSLLLLSILLTAGLSVVTVAALEKRSGLSTQKSTVAFQAADSGTERVLKKIYIDNSPALTDVAWNGSMPEATLGDVAANLNNVTGATCNAGTKKVSATNDSAPGYSFEISFLDGSDVAIACNDTQWRDKVIKIRTMGFFRQASRVIELGIKPRLKCNPTDTVSYDGQTYGMLPIGDQCWMNRSLDVGTMINSSVNQTNNGTIEKYCYNDQASNCTNPHPTRPDGGLYAWSEAMAYTTNEGARGICPNGWHIPTDAEWYQLEHFVDPTINDPNAFWWRGTDGGTKLRPGGNAKFEANQAGFESPVPLSAVPTYSGLNQRSFFWSSSEASSGNRAYSRAFSSIGTPPEPEQIYRANPMHQKEFGFSVRCIMD